MRNFLRNAIGIGALILVIYAITNSRSATTSTAADPTRNTETAAEISDEVSIKYPASTIMCSSATDAFQVYLAGELAFSETYRLEDSIWKAVSARQAARKLEMRNAYSCKWAHGNTRYVVEQKIIIGTEKDALHVVKYCLKPIGSSAACDWTEELYGTSSGFEDVKTSKQP